MRLSLFGVRRAAAAVALAALCTCSKLDHIDVDETGSATIPKATLVDKLLGSTLDFAGLDSIDLTEDFQNQGVTKDDVDGVKVKSFTLTIDGPPGQTFDFMESITFTASADGIDPIEIAGLETIPRGVTVLTLDVNEDAELEPYVVAPSMTITSKVKGTRPDADTAVSAQVTLDVDVHLPGCE